MSVPADLNRLEHELRRLQRSEAVRRLNSGIPHAHARRMLNPAGLDAPDALLDLYEWRNGMSTEGAVLGDIDLLPGFHFPTLDDSLQNYWAFREHPRWNDWWFPFLADGGGDFYVTDLNAPHCGAIRRFRIEETELPIEFESLDRMLETVIAA